VCEPGVAADDGFPDVEGGRCGTLLRLLGTSLRRVRPRDENGDVVQLPGWADGGNASAVRARSGTPRPFYPVQMLRCGPAVTIAEPSSGETVEAQLEGRRVQHAVADPSQPEEQRQSADCYRLPSRPGGASRARQPTSSRCWTRHGFGSGRCSEKGILATVYHAGRARLTGCHRGAVERLPSFSTAEAVRADDE
jgi:hypothetical protein